VIRATLDSNILISALEFQGIGSRLIGMARAGTIRIDTSDAILDETASCGTSSYEMAIGCILPGSSYGKSRIAWCLDPACAGNLQMPGCRPATS
jgi:hypothetical protein